MAYNGAYPWMRFFPKEFRSDALGFSAGEKEVYMELIFAAWDRDGALPLCPNALSRITGLKPQAIKLAMETLHERKLACLDSGTLRLRVVDRELLHAHKYFSQRRAAGIRSGETRRIRMVSSAAAENAE